MGTRRTNLDHRRSRRRGLVLMYSMVFLTALLAIASLAVDYGHAQLAKLEVQRSADLAARAAAYQLANGGDPVVAAAAALYAAQQVAGFNKSDSAPLALGPSDVLIGNYDTTQSPAFLAGRLPLNAVTVSVKRDGATNPKVPLMLAPMIGMSSVAVTASAMAHVVPPTSPYGMVGINWVNFGSVGVLATVNGDLVSNGTVSVGVPLGIGVSVTGNAQSYTASTLKGSVAVVSGQTSPMSSSLNYPSVVVPSSNNNVALGLSSGGGSDYTVILGALIPAGTYVVHDLNMLAGIAVNLQGPVTFYVTGTVRIAAGVNLLGSTNTTATNFTINVAKGGSVLFLANLLVPVAMVVYAPDSDIVIAVGVSNFKGTLIGKTLTVGAAILCSFTEVKPTVKPATVTTDK